MATAKQDVTAGRILDVALDRFRTNGFEATTMREIAAAAEVATGAAYYYFPSKEAIVLAFYERAWTEMQPLLASALEGAHGFEGKFSAVAAMKLKYFAANRPVLKALLRNGADPRHELSPFGERTKEIRESDWAWYAQLLKEAGVKVPKDLEPHLPGVLWLIQMGVIYFWLTDESAGQKRTLRLLELAAKSVGTLLKLSSLPLTRPLRRTAIEMIELVKGTV